MKIGSIILGLIVVFVGFWFVYRPYAVRKKCSSEALESAVFSTQSYYPLDMVKRQDKQNDLIKEFYLSCVRSKGLKQ